MEKIEIKRKCVEKLEDKIKFYFVKTKVRRGRKNLDVVNCRIEVEDFNNNISNSY